MDRSYLRAAEGQQIWTEWAILGEDRRRISGLGFEPARRLATVIAASSGVLMVWRVLIEGEL